MNKRSDQTIDAWLVLRCQSGDRKAFQLLFHRWNKRMQWLAYRKVHSTTDASDVVQDIWLAVAKGIRSLHDPNRFRPWVMRILERKCADYIKTDIRQSEIIKNVQTTFTSTSNVDKNEDVVELEKAFQQLPSEMQHLLTLYYSEDLKIDEIAETVSEPSGTIKWKLFEARKKLKQLMKRR